MLKIGKVFGYAFKVVTWLGIEENTSSRTIDLLETLSEYKMIQARTAA